LHAVGTPFNAAMGMWHFAFSLTVSILTGGHTA